MVNNQITAAGNQFINTSNAEGHFFNNCDFSGTGTVATVSYWFDGSTVENPLQNCNLAIQGGDNNLCPDHYPTTHPDATGTIGLAQLQAFKTEYYAHLSDYTRLQTRYNRLMDKGNRDSLRQVIQNTPHQNQPIRRMQDSLEVIAPYLTDTMLVAIATDGLFSRSQVKSILSEVPHAALESTLLQMLRDTLAYTPLTLNDLDWLLTKAQQNINKPKAKDRTALETAMGYHIAEMERLATEITFEYLKDTTNTDSVTAWLRRFSGLENQYTLINWLWQTQGSQAAIDELNDLPNRYPSLVGYCRSCNPYYAYTWLKLIKNTIKAVEDDHRSFAELTIGEVQNLENIANLGEDAGLARLQARSILNFFYGYNYEDEPKLPATTVLRLAQNDTTTIEQPHTSIEMKPALAVNPNPTNNWVKFEYNLETAENAVLMVVNVNGEILYTTPITNIQGNLVWEIPHHLPSGVYFVVVKAKGAAPVTQRFSVIR